MSWRELKILPFIALLSRARFEESKYSGMIVIGAGCVVKLGALLSDLERARHRDTLRVPSLERLGVFKGEIDEH